MYVYLIIIINLSIQIIPLIFLVDFKDNLYKLCLKITIYIIVASSIAIALKHFLGSESYMPYAVITSTLSGIILLNSVSIYELKQNVFIGSIYFNIFIGINNLIILIPKNFDKNPLLILFIFYILLCPLPIYFYRKNLLKKLREFKVDNNHWNNINILSAIYFISQLTFQVIYKDDISRSYEVKVTVFLIMFLLMIASYIIIIKFIFSVSTLNHVQYDLLRMHVYENQIKDLINNEENYKRIKHDTRHHLKIIEEMLINKKYQDVMKYINEYDMSINAKLSNKYGENITFNAIINIFEKEAVNSGITYDTSSLFYCDELELSAIDITKIFSNVIENAINANNKIEGGPKLIKMRALIKDNKYIFICENTFEGTLKLDENGYPINSKRKGIGVNSIIETVERNEGIAYFKISEDIFKCQIIFKIN